MIPASSTKPYHLTLLSDFIKAYPNCFYRKKKQKKPLIIGIHQQLMDNHPDIDPIHIKKALRSYIRKLAYYYSYEKYSQRIDLNGDFVADITDEEKAFAKEMIKKIKSERKITN